MSRPLSAFMLFSNDIRETVNREHPDLGFLQISSEIGRRWKWMTPEQRRPYEEMSAANNSAPPPAPAPAPPLLGRSAISPFALVDGRKQELSAYLTFCQQAGDAVLAEHPTKSMEEIAHLLADRYFARTGASQVAIEATAQPTVTPLAADSSMGGFGTSSPSHVGTEAPPHSPYVYFCLENRAKLEAANPGKSPKEIAVLLADCWRKLSEKERDEYREMLDAAKTKYESAINRDTQIETEEKQEKEA